VRASLDAHLGRERTGRLGKHALQAAILLGFYYLVPVDGGDSATQLWLRALVSGLLLAGAVWFVVRTVVREAGAEDEDVDLDRLVLAAVTGIIAFALADLAIARAAPGQFTGLATKADGLYFALSTLSTVGYGDIHPVGQLARHVVTLQLVFNVIVLAAAARTLTRGLAGRSPRGRRPGHRPGDGGA
jgi:TRAP-type C4-dicarboxylate transport system permease large subunit